MPTNTTSTYEIERAEMESARNAAWDAYVAARPDMNRDPIYERLFNAGFERAWKTAKERKNTHG